MNQDNITETLVAIGKVDTKLDALKDTQILHHERMNSINVDLDRLDGDIRVRTNDLYNKFSHYSTEVVKQARAQDEKLAKVDKKVFAITTIAGVIWGAIILAISKYL